MKNIIKYLVIISFLLFSNNSYWEFKESNEIDINKIEVSSNQSEAIKAIDWDVNSKFDFKETDNQLMVRLKFKRSEIDSINLNQYGFSGIWTIYIYDWLKEVWKINNCKKCDINWLVWNEIVLSLIKASYTFPVIKEIVITWREKNKENIYNQIDIMFTDFFKKIENESVENKVVKLWVVYKKIEKIKNSTKSLKVRNILDYCLWLIWEKLSNENENLEGLKIVRKIFNEQ